jgi:hypothetical protein
MQSIHVYFQQNGSIPFLQDAISLTSRVGGGIV